MGRYQTMEKRSIGRLGAILVVAAVAFAGLSCDLITGDDVGACVSDVVTYSQIGDKVYCYSDWSESECEANDRENVNGAGWTFYGGDSCQDRGLAEGSNPAP